MKRSRKASWKATMAAKYGPDWRDEMRRRGLKGGRPAIEDEYTNLPISRQRKSLLRKKLSKH